MNNVWISMNISSICSEEKAPLTQCSSTGVMFLALVMRLFGRVSYSVPDRNINLCHPFYNDFLSHKFENSIENQSELHFNVGSKDLEEDNYAANRSQLISKSLDLSIPNVTINYTTSIKRNKKALQNNDTKISQIILPSETKNEFETKGKLLHKKKKKAYDFIIVGAGSAGSVLANRLSEIKEWKILLIEAGGEEPDVTMVPSFSPTLRGSNIDWNFKTEPENLTCRSQKDQRCSWTSGKTMGGSSAVNFLVYMRGNRLDYDNWAKLGNVGWSYKEILSYLKKSENNRDIETLDKYYHGVGGPLNVEKFSYTDVNTAMLVDAFKEKGLPIIDLTGPNNLGTNIALSTSKNGRRWSANIGYIKPIRSKRCNLDILTNTLVTKIIIDENTRTAQGVTYIRNGKISSVYSRKEVIISGGGINSPKLLMLSGIGPKQHLNSLNIPVLADLPVGYNLQNHATTDALIINLSNKTSTAIDGHRLEVEIQKYKNQEPNKFGPLATTSTLNSIAFFKTKYAKDPAPDIQVHFDGRNVKDFYSDPTNYLATNIFPLSFYDGIAARPLLLVPKSRGFLLLNKTDPIFSQPLIYSRFFTIKEDLDVLIEAIQLTVGLEETEIFKRNGAKFNRESINGCKQYIWGTYDYFVCILMEYTSVIYHHVGTCKMGPAEDKEAVIDSRLRVYGFKNIGVIDSSIMPTIVRGNTNAPTIMIAEKGADMLKEDNL